MSSLGLSPSQVHLVVATWKPKRRPLYYNPYYNPTIRTSSTPDRDHMHILYTYICAVNTYRDDIEGAHRFGIGNIKLHVQTTEDFGS